MEEAVEAVQGLKRKHPNTDVGAILKQLKVEKTYISEPIGSQIHVQGDAFGRSIVRSAFVLAVQAGDALLPRHKPVCLRRGKGSPVREGREREAGRFSKRSAK